MTRGVREFARTARASREARFAFSHRRIRCVRGHRDSRVTGDARRCVRRHSTALAFAMSTSASSSVSSSSDAAVRADARPAPRPCPGTRRPRRRGTGSAPPRPGHAPAPASAGAGTKLCSPSPSAQSVVASSASRKSSSPRRTHPRAQTDAMSTPHAHGHPAQVVGLVCRSRSPPRTASAQARSPRLPTDRTAPESVRASIHRARQPRSHPRGRGERDGRGQHAAEPPCSGPRIAHVEGTSHRELRGVLALLRRRALEEDDSLLPLRRYDGRARLRRLGAHSAEKVAARRRAGRGLRAGVGLALLHREEPPATFTYPALVALRRLRHVVEDRSRAPWTPRSSASWPSARRPPAPPSPRPRRTAWHTAVVVAPHSMAVRSVEIRARRSLLTSGRSSVYSQLQIWWRRTRMGFLDTLKGLFGGGASTRCGAAGSRSAPPAAASCSGSSKHAAEEEESSSDDGERRNYDLEAIDDAARFDLLERSPRLLHRRVPHRAGLGRRSRRAPSSLPNTDSQRAALPPGEGHRRALHPERRRRRPSTATWRHHARQDEGHAGLHDEGHAGAEAPAASSRARSSPSRASSLDAWALSSR